MSVNDYGIETLKKAAEQDPASSNPAANYRYVVRVGNAAEEAIPVYIVADPDPSTEETINYSSQALAVTTGIPTTLLTYTVPALKTFSLESINCGGDNIAKYTVTIDGIFLAQKRSMFSDAFDVTFKFDSDSNGGLILDAGQIIQVTIIHNRLDSADFEALLVGVLNG